MNPDSQVVGDTDKCVSDDGYTTVVRRQQKRDKVSTIKGQPVNISSNRVSGLSSKKGEVRHSKRAKAHYI